MRSSPVRRVSSISLAALALGATALMGCGSDDDSSTSASTSGSTAAASTTTGGGGGGNADVSGKKIAYVDIFLQAPIDKRMNDIFNLGAEAVGWDVTTTDAKGDGQTVSQQMTAAINNNVDAIVTTAEPSLIKGPLEQAKEKGIPVIAVGGENTHDLDDLLSGVYSEDDDLMSEILGEKICEEQEEGGKIAILRFDLFYSGKIRGDVVKQMAEECGLEVVAEPATEQTFASAQQKSAAIMSQFPDLAAIVPVYDTFTSGAVEAIKSAGKADQTDVYSFYADSVNNPLMTENENVVGLVDGTMGYGSTYAIDRLLAYFANGEEIPKEVPADLYEYEVIGRDNIPPAGQDGPLPLEDYVAKFEDQWVADYGLGQ